MLNKLISLCCTLPQEYSLFQNCCSITIVSIFPSPLSPTPPSVLSPFGFVHGSLILVRWWPFPFFAPLSPSPLPSGHCQFVLYFNVSGSTLLACLFCSLGSTFICIGVPSSYLTSVILNNIFILKFLNLSILEVWPQEGVGASPPLKGPWGPAQGGSQKRSFPIPGLSPPTFPYTPQYKSCL